MHVTLITCTPNPEKTVAAAAKLCYSDTDAMHLMDGMSDEDAGNFVKMLASYGHESPIEHVSFTFGIEGVSRALLAQITRHRIASFSVQSQRYVKQEHFEYITPPEIAADAETAKVYADAMQYSVDAYNRLADMLEERHYQEFLKEGVPEKTARSRAEKKAIEDARFVLPNACETKMVMTMNARSLLNFFRMRCCNRAQWEIRALAREMFRLCYEQAPTIFAKAGPSCCAGPCPEGKMTCGKCEEVRREYAEIKEGILK
ncbi:MAG: FAD-dependent thymidylate synthase [Oscillospiraceae bacterium]|nr:FAD-dependent thymidylate synthase [Oscillospiraceae bacterium]MBR4100672.1 FAD-dependent thymidylate synthase [Oscillospiraceae bacterium]